MVADDVNDAQCFFLQEVFINNRKILEKIGKTANGDLKKNIEGN